MVHEFLSSLVDAVDVAVNVNSVPVGPVIGLVNVKFVEAFTDFNLVDVLGNVDHLGSVLHETAVLSFRGLVGAQASPLSGVQISSFEVRLATHQRRGHTAHVR